MTIISQIVSVFYFYTRENARSLQFYQLFIIQYLFRDQHVVGCCIRYCLSVSFLLFKVFNK